MEVIFVEHLKNLICSLASFNDVLHISVRFVKSIRFCTLSIKCSLHFINKVLFAPTSYAKMFGND